MGILSFLLDIIVEEIANLKDIVLKLQSYTMDVNKTLLEERINILSDLGSNGHPIENQVFEISSDPSANDNADITEPVSE